MSTDPTIARRRLGIRLRELRETRSLRLEDVAASLNLAPSTVSRIETGNAPTRPFYLAAMLDVYGVDDPELRQLLADLAQAGGRKPWWAACADLLPDDAGRYLSLETAASVVRSYSTQTVPALLQTARYAKAVCQAERPGLTADQNRTLVDITMRRQQIVQCNDAHLHLIMDESVLLRTIAPADVMAAQRDHLCAVAARPSVTLQVAAMDRPLPVLSPPFTVLTFIDPADTDLAVSYGPSGQVIINTRDSDAAAMLATFTALAEAGLSAADSKSMISDLMIRCS